jgi:proline dehydrogenase
MLTAIDVAADFEDKLGARDALSRRTWVAIKLVSAVDITASTLLMMAQTALLPDAHALTNLSLDLVAAQAQASATKHIPFPGVPLSTSLDGIQNETAPKGSSLSSEEIHALRELRDDLFDICEHAEQRGVKIIMDAEYRCMPLAAHL